MNTMNLLAQMQTVLIELLRLRITIYMNGFREVSLQVMDLTYAFDMIISDRIFRKTSVVYTCYTCLAGISIGNYHDECISLV